MTVIELGLVGHDGDRPAGPPRRAPLRVVFRRVRVLVAAVAALCLPTLAGSARPVSHSPQQLWSAPFAPDNGDVFSVGSGRVFVLTAGGVLTAYGADDGAVHWSAKGLTGAAWVSPTDFRLVLLPVYASDSDLESQDGGQTFRQHPHETIALDAATGREIWRLPGEAAVAEEGRVVLVERDDANVLRTVHVVRLHDGAPVWSRPAAGLETWTAGGTPGATADRLATVGRHGEVKVYDMADGRLVADGVVPWLGQDEQGESYSEVMIEKGTLYVHNIQGGKGRITAFDTATMQRKWRVDVSSDGGFYPCGPVLCISGPDGTSGHDRETGAARWSVPGMASGVPLPDGTLMTSSRDADSRNTLVDAATGRPIAELGAGTPVWEYSTSPRRPYLLNRVSQPADRMTVSELDDTGKVRLRGTIAPVLDDSCQAAGDLLVCAAPHGRLTVTDVG
ncbi:outer membrane protein assembly factor BamB family protein [Couchioplanes caeruleus]|uniref:Pyrrolo-quinoline quinone repeat domain-containing protein n=2 Tax=Couchioplanes caeruleus TaxID=56438 RepID=A0A1K0GCT2_9ACTN|nr:PQQ-binding-like beta-propeller repeat protein [Couchioplanes caeruleus]OJF15050.1 hypothetical protein BG844_06600 [Couchioplanes caeruleus subsp. caeruleus]ROP32318.1 putative pyrroloquinoline-quinone binding quinoprotein [Couchioplanes caeruleus]